MLPTTVEFTEFIIFFGYSDIKGHEKVFLQKRLSVVGVK